MKEIMLHASDSQGLSDAEIIDALRISLQGRRLKKVLLLPPDFTRRYSYAGVITNWYYNALKDICRVDVMPALGTHDPVSEKECLEFYGIGRDKIIDHNWRTDIRKMGVVPGSFVREASEGLMADDIDVELNYRLLDKSYDLIISIGQVVPHEVVGMANYGKNIFVGCGGLNMINSTHMLGAFYGMERIMGRDRTPVRQVFDFAETNFLKEVPLLYVLSVTTREEERVKVHGLFIGRERVVFEEAVKLSREKNLIFVSKPLKKVVVFLEEREFKSTWLGNKAIYRTRMAIADGGQLIILAPGVRKFGEDDGNDCLIRKYGYVGREKVLELCWAQADLRDNLSVAAHLIHGSSDGRFSITYAARLLSRQEVEGVNFEYMPYDQAIQTYNPDILEDGFNTLENGEEIFYISNPALGLWADKNRF